MFPSGYNFDGYVRDYSYEGEHYHFYALLPSVLGAEAASHNGFDAWSYQNNALLRTFQKGSILGRPARRGESINNWLPSFWIAYRRFPDDPVIQSSVTNAAAASSLLGFLTILFLYGERWGRSCLRARRVLLRHRIFE